VVQWDIGAMLSADGAADESVSPQSGISRHGVLQCAEAGRFATPTAPRPASARDSPWGQDTSVRLSFG
jgi:hypothetical protein